MITLEIGGRSVAIAPFKLGQLRKAAPFVDSMNAMVKKEKAAKEAGESPSMELAMDLMHACIEIVAVATMRVDPALTADAIEDEVDINALEPLKVAVFELLKQSGLNAGEAKAPAPDSPAAGAEALVSSSAESSPS